jgi:hypothetical protein
LLRAARSKKGNVHWWKEWNESITQFVCIWVARSDACASGHNHIGQPDDHWHHGRPHRHRRSGVEELPHYRNTFQPCRYRSVRIDEATNDDEIDLGISNQPSNSRNPVE